MATVGGNLLQRPRCWYFRNERFVCIRKGGAQCFALDGENAYHAVLGYRACCAVHPSSLASALLALGASVELTGPRGTERRNGAILRARREGHDATPYAPTTRCSLPSRSRPPPLAHRRRT